MTAIGARPSALFGLFGRENDCVIPWSAVEDHWEDAVLVDHIPVKVDTEAQFTKFL